MRRFVPLVGFLRSLARHLRPVGHAGRVLAVDLLGLVPALIFGAGIFLVVAGLFLGLFNYSTPPTAQSDATETAISGSALPTISIAPPSLASPGSSTFAGGAPTRIVVPALAIDLPIIASPPNEGFPFCNVAEYLTLGESRVAPGLPQATYLYAHARAGMFLPLLTVSQKNNGQSMIGDTVEIYTDDDVNHIYEINEVIRHVPVSSTSLEKATNARTDQLWMQTSEGQYDSSTKLQVVASPVGVLAASHTDAHPTGKGRVCAGAPKCASSGQVGCTP